MSLLLDALKKSEAQRKRGSSPTIDLTRTPLSGRPRRPIPRGLSVVLAGVLLLAAAPWWWPYLSDRFEARNERASEPGSPVEVANIDGESARPNSTPVGDIEEFKKNSPVRKTASAPVAGASSARSAAAEVPPTSAPETRGGTDRTGDQPDEGSGSGAAAGEPEAADAESPLQADASSVEELRRRVQAGRQQARPPESAPAQAAAPARRVNQPADNFIRPWELPQAQRAEFPALRLNVHFYAEREADRFVLMNGERYTEGQRVAPGTTLVEIRKRGAVVEFGSYRVLIE